MKQNITFVDINDNNCEIELSEPNVILGSLGPSAYIELTANQAKQLAKVLNYWADNKELPTGDLKFDFEKSNITQHVVFQPVIPY